MAALVQEVEIKLSRKEEVKRKPTFHHMNCTVFYYGENSDCATKEVSKQKFKHMVWPSFHFSGALLSSKLIGTYIDKLLLEMS